MERNVVADTETSGAASGEPGADVELGFNLGVEERRYAITRLQILDEEGRVDEQRDPGLDADKLQYLYRSMVLARAVDDRMLKLQRQGRIGTFPPCAGQEAAICASTLAIRDTDWYVCSFREEGGRLMRGEPIENIFTYYGGYEEGNVFEGCERTLPIAVIIGSQTAHAVGVAYGMSLRGEKDTAVLCYVGDGATSEGDFHEALNFAAVWQAPVVFVCQNNHWAISMPREAQTRSETIAQKAIAYGIPGIQVDGNDVLAVYRATSEAVKRAREGGGPTLIEAVTYRLWMHTTADDPSRYRSEEQVKAWQKLDPIPRLRRYLEAKAMWDEKSQQELEADLKRRIDEAVQRFEAQTGYAPDAPFDYVFGSKHPRIEEQRAEFLEELRRDAGDA